MARTESTNQFRIFETNVSGERYSQDDRLIPRWDKKFLTRLKNFRYNNDAHDDKDVNNVYWSEATRRQQCWDAMRWLGGVDEENGVQSGFENSVSALAERIQSRLYSLVARRLGGSSVGTTEPLSHPNEYI